MRNIIVLSPIYTEDSNNLKKASLPPAIVLDFGIIKGKGWALIEANPAWCSGLYACDAEKALEVIVKSCIKN
ncbi:ATP-grasp domain-containing protein [Chryseobacterium sp. JV558]|uniref:ATP-grasp domain-containing protein n=1 Tax=Chryseobacterium sp. JV558 TaxID=2663236 RepID=UPI00299CE92B|nr:ATP-grasp domain-containing protein [Chryseobacterium sp. JV558]MDW9381914.1 DUF4343 domain-containing protein [Chryseobacterium sp. JV558]